MYPQRGTNDFRAVVGGGGYNPIFAHGKMCHERRGKNIRVPLFPYTFFPFVLGMWVVQLRTPMPDILNSLYSIDYMKIFTYWSTEHISGA